MPTFLLIGILSMLGIIIVGTIVRVVQSSYNKRSPIISCKAQIVNVRENSRFVRNGRNFSLLNWECRITIKFLSNGKRKMILVPLRELEDMAKGELGILTLQDTRFISFERQKDRAPGAM